MPNVIRVGDPTDHGGQVVASGAPFYKIDGIAVALKGDACSCPKRGHNNCTIASGSATHAITGVPVAYEGDTTTCGAVLQSTIGTFTQG